MDVLGKNFPEKVQEGLLVKFMERRQTLNGICSIQPINLFTNSDALLKHAFNAMHCGLFNEMKVFKVL